MPAVSSPSVEQKLLKELPYSQQPVHHNGASSHPAPPVVQEATGTYSERITGANTIGTSFSAVGGKGVSSLMMFERGGGGESSTGRSKADADAAGSRVIRVKRIYNF